MPVNDTENGTIAKKTNSLREISAASLLNFSTKCRANEKSADLPRAVEMPRASAAPLQAAMRSVATRSARRKKGEAFP